MNDLEVALLSPNHWQDRLNWVDWKKTQWSTSNKYTYVNIIPATWRFAAPYRYDARKFLQFYPGHVLAASFCWHFVGFHTACTHASSGDGSCPRLFTARDALTYPACSHAVKRDCLNWLPLEKTSWRQKKHIWNVKRNTKARTVVAATCIQIRESIALYYIIWLYTHISLIYTYLRMSQVSPSLEFLSCALIPASLAAKSSWSPFCQLQLMLAALKEAAEGWICMPHRGKLEKVKTEWEKICQQTTCWMDSEYLCHQNFGGCPCSTTKVLNKGCLRSQSFTRKRWDNNI